MNRLCLRVRRSVLLLCQPVDLQPDVGGLYRRLGEGKRMVEGDARFSIAPELLE